MNSAYNSGAQAVLVTPAAPLTTPLLKGAGGMASYKPIPSFSADEIEKFWSFVPIDMYDTDACWPWAGFTKGKKKGYGSFKHFYAHRVAYALVKGPIPDGFTIDHLCRNHACVNPAHLEAVPSRVNTLRGSGYTALKAKQTHCRAGHLLAGANVKRVGSRQGRVCVTCKRANDGRRNAKRGKNRGR